MSKLDFLGNEIEVGDQVVFMQLKYRNLMKGEVVKITDQKVKIKHEPTNTFRTHTMQDFNQVVKINTEK